MLDHEYVEKLAQALISRMLPYLQNDKRGTAREKRLLTVKEAAAYLGRKSEQSIYHLVNRGEIPCVRHGRNLRFDRLDLDKWIESDKA